MFPRSCWVGTEVLAVATVTALKAKVFLISGQDRLRNGIVVVKVGVAIARISVTLIFFLKFIGVQTLRPPLASTSTTIMIPTLVTTSGR